MLPLHQVHALILQLRLPPAIPRASGVGCAVCFRCRVCGVPPLPFHAGPPNQKSIVQKKGKRGQFPQKVDKNGVTAPRTASPGARHRPPAPPPPARMGKRRDLFILHAQQLSNRRQGETQRSANLFYRRCLQSRFTKVNSRTNLSKYALLLLI